MACNSFNRPTPSGPSIMHCVTTVVYIMENDAERADKCNARYAIVSFSCSTYSDALKVILFKLFLSFVTYDNDIVGGLGATSTSVFLSFMSAITSPSCALNSAFNAGNPVVMLFLIVGKSVTGSINLFNLERIKFSPIVTLRVSNGNPYVSAM